VANSILPVLPIEEQMKRLLSICILTLCTLFLGAQDLWTLEESIHRARTGSIDALQSLLGQDYAAINLESAQHRRYPNLNFNTNVNWNFGRTIDPTTNEFNTSTFFSNNLSLGSGMALYRGGRIKNSITQSEYLLKASEMDHEQLINDLALTVANNYLNALFALENEKIARNQLGISNQQLAQIQKLVKAGSLPANEVLQIEAQIARDEQSIIGSSNTYELSILQLKQLLNLNPSDEITIENPGEINLSTDPFILTFEEVYASALQHRQDVLADELRLQSSEMAIKVAEGALMPSLDAFGNLGTNYSNLGFSILGSETLDIPVDSKLPDGTPFPLLFTQERTLSEKANYSTQLEDNLSYGFGVQLSVPIYNNFQVKHSIQRAELDFENSKLATQRTKENLKIQVQSALADSRSAKLQFEASEVAYNAQKAAFDNTEKKYRLGATNTFEYSNAKNQLDAAQLNTLIAKYDYIFKTVVLDFYMGKPIKL